MRERSYFETRHLLLLWGAVSCIAAGLLLYALESAMAWDEGFHLLAAQLIESGKRPYLDFCFPQTPLNAYWNAFWMKLFDGSWRTTHVVAALATSGAVLLTGDFLWRRFPVVSWRLAAALSGVAAVGLNVLVVYFGTIAQAYGLCLLLIVGAFRLTILAVEKDGPLLAGLAGLLAGAAASSSLLTAPVGPVLVLWSLVYGRAGRRAAQFVVFCLGYAAAFVPLLWLFLKSPHQVFFDVVEYYALYRRVGWPGAIRHDLELMVSWIDSAQGLILILLAAAGLLFIHYRSQWERRSRAEFYLCGWLIFGLCAYLCNIHPHVSARVFFVLTAPFLGVLAAVGLYSVASRLYAPGRPFLPVFVLSLLLASGLAKGLYDERDDFEWRDMERLAAKVEEVTPPGAPLLADESIYFLTRRPPPPGMELRDSHKLELPADLAKSVHIVTGSEFLRQIKSGMYSTVETCDGEEKIKERGLPRLYAKRADIEDCSVFWDKVDAAQPSTLH